MSRKLTVRLQQQLGDATDEEFINAAFETILQVQPSDEETAACRETLEKLTAALREGDSVPSAARVRENLAHALLNHNDFVTVR